MSTVSIFRASVAGISLLLGAAGAHAGQSLDQEQARALVAEGRILPLQRIMQRHAHLLRGRLLDLELEYDHGRLIYELEVMGEDGVVRELEVDAASGALLKHEIED